MGKSSKSWSFAWRLLCKVWALQLRHIHTHTLAYLYSYAYVIYIYMQHSYPKRTKVTHQATKSKWVLRVVAQAVGHEYSTEIA